MADPNTFWLREAHEHYNQAKQILEDPNNVTTGLIAASIHATLAQVAATMATADA